jgi:hypothetical protein
MRITGGLAGSTGSPCTPPMAVARLTLVVTPATARLGSIERLPSMSTGIQRARNTRVVPWSRLTGGGKVVVVQGKTQQSTSVETARRAAMPAVLHMPSPGATSW